MTTIPLDVNPFLALCPDFSREVAQRTAAIILPSRIYSPLSFTTNSERHTALVGAKKVIDVSVRDSTDD